VEQIHRSRAEPGGNVLPNLGRDFGIDRKRAAAGGRQRNAEIADRLALRLVVGDQLADARDIGRYGVAIVAVDAVADVKLGADGDELAGAWTFAGDASASAAATSVPR